MLTAFGPIGRWKLAGSAQDQDLGAGGEARLRQRRYVHSYQRFRHHLWSLILVIFIKTLFNKGGA